MAKDAEANGPRIYCDLNGQMTERRYLPTNGTIDDLAALGLTLESAVGRRFWLTMPDADEHGNPGAFVASGTVVIDPEFGFLLKADEEDFEWRSESGGLCLPRRSTHIVERSDLLRHAGGYVGYALSWNAKPLRSERPMTTPPVDIHKGFHDVDASGASETFNAYLQNLHAMPAWVQSRRVRFELAKLSNGEAVLDAGCGIGMDLPELWERVGAAGRIVGFDFSEEMLARAKERAASLSTPTTFQHGDLHQLPFEDASFDAVWAERVFMYLERPLDAVREVLRVLRPGGRFIAGEIDFAAVWMVSRDEAFRQALQDRTMRSVRNPLLARQLPGLCMQAGFARVQVEPTMTLNREFAHIERAANYQWHIDRMIEEGEVARDQGYAWLEAQRRISAEGAFVSMLIVPNLLAVK